MSSVQQAQSSQEVRISDRMNRATAAYRGRREPNVPVLCYCQCRGLGKVSYNCPQKTTVLGKLIRPAEDGLPPAKYDEYAPLIAMALLACRVGLPGSTPASFNEYRSFGTFGQWRYGVTFLEMSFTRI